jgi:phosphoglycerate dehydrogenase-like enzyme
MPGSVIHVYHERAVDLAGRVRRVAPERQVVPLATAGELAACIDALEIVFAPVPPREGWAGARRLRLIQLLGVGVDQLLPSPDLPEEVEVAGVRGVFAADVAEHALAMMLVHARRIPELLALQRERTYDAHARPSLAGRRLTVLGMGEVGRHLVRIARALGMDVRGVARTARTIDGIDVIADPAAGVVDAHYVVLALPLTPATRHLVDAALLARLSPNAFLINVARGGVVDERALLDALLARRLAGAALDVFEEEPLPRESPLWTAPGVIVTPHVAGLGERYVDRCIDVLVDNARRLDRGEPRRCLVDRAAGY